MKSIRSIAKYAFGLTLATTSLLAARPSKLSATPNPIKVGSVISLSAKVGPREEVQFQVKGRPIGQVRADARGNVRMGYFVKGTEFPMKQSIGTINWSVNNLSDRNYETGSTFVAQR